jgi:hypothetical protein
MSARKRNSTARASGKRSKGSGGLTVSLSPNERSALLRSYRLWPRTRHKIETVADESLRFTKKELCLLLEEISALSDFDDDAPRAVLGLLRERIVEKLEEDNPPAFGCEHLRALDGGLRTSKVFFQFRIALLDTEPPIWRRIQIADGPLSLLHYAIQGAFDWEECHLHQFEIGGLRFGPPPPKEFLDFGLPLEDESQVTIGQLLPSTGKQTAWLYTYDFGDNWEHEVLFEGCGPMVPRTKYPLCIEGRGAAPPEDCGGPWGFAEILRSLAGPNAERDDELMQWLGPFDPEAFDAQQTSKNMRHWARVAHRH